MSRMSLGALAEPGKSSQFQHAGDCSLLRRAGAVFHGLGAVTNLQAEEWHWELEVVQGVHRAIPPQGHFSPSATASLQIHGTREVTGNLIDFKTATCPESVRCLSRQDRESKMFTASGDMVTVKQGGQAGLPGMSWPRRGETNSIPDVLLEIPFSPQASPQQLCGTSWGHSGRPNAPVLNPLLWQSPGMGGSPGLQRSCGDSGEGSSTLSALWVGTSLYLFFSC